MGYPLNSLAMVLPAGVLSGTSSLLWHLGQPVMRVKWRQSEYTMPAGKNAIHSTISIMMCPLVIFWGLTLLPQFLQM
jgi:hypothetical protein